MRQFSLCPSICLALIITLCASSAGCGRRPHREVGTSPTVFVDTKSKDLFVAPPGTIEIPLHPTTAKATLSHALYCSPCKAWHPVPPPDVLLQQEKLRTCSKAKQQMQNTGPIPETAPKLDLPQN
ncbi:hypothetical protein [Planctomicrobium sp. SH527]|uniref:hypothetical protein n=1 Tax=Planctomicrobium sp. SH527 TaxID=3448123 RepID=UPI003F5CB60E